MTMNRALLLSVSLILLSSSVFALETENPVSLEMNEKSTINILSNGDARVNEQISFTTSAFNLFKQQYPNLNTYARIFKPENQPIQIEDLDVDVDEFNNEIIASYTVKGVAVNNGDSLWGVAVAPVGQKVTLSAETAESLVFTYTDFAAGYNKIITTTINAPIGAYNLAFNKESNVMSYQLDYFEDTGLGNFYFLIFGLLLLVASVVNFKLKY
ncbi:MAG: hypothetical protein V1672_02950 [Candidatus Diapherotrites archaeon]